MDSECTSAAHQRFVLFLLPLWRASAPRRSSRVLVADMDCVGGSQKPRRIVLVDWILPLNVACKASSCLVQLLDLTRLAPALLVNLSLLSCDSGALLDGVSLLVDLFSLYLSESNKVHFDVSLSKDRVCECSSRGFEAITMFFCVFFCDGSLMHQVCEQIDQRFLVLQRRILDRSW